MKKSLVIIAILTLPAVFYLFKPGFFPSHDGDWIVIRLTAFHQSLADGHFPPRWSQRLNHSYGYPVLNFLYPLPLYLGEFLYLVTSSFILSIKLLLALSFTFSAFTMFIWLKNKITLVSALAASLIYVYTPYRFVDTYVRGSVGESVAFIFIPLIFLGIDLIKKKSVYGFFLTAVAAALTFLSHNTFIFFLGLAFIYGLITLNSSDYKNLFLSFLFSAGLSAFFWLPALSELKYVSLSQIQVTDVSRHLAALKDLILPSWSYNQPSYQLGLVNLAVFISAVWLLFSQKFKNKNAKFFIITFAVSALLIHRLSLVFWQYIPGVSIIQFPWRLLSVTTFASAVLSGLILNFFDKKQLAYLLVLTALILNFNYLKPLGSRPLTDNFFATNDDTTTTWQEYMPIWVKNFPANRPQQRFQIISGQADILNYNETNISKSFQARVKQLAIIQFASVYYPGWQATVNDQISPILYTDYNGMTTLNLPAGESSVKLRFRETPLRLTANYLTLISLLSLTVYFSLCVKKQRC